MTVRKPIIGTIPETGHDLSLEFNRLLVSRLLIQANSGGGKSWLVRRLLEQTYGLAQQIIIDPEGEFATLREKHDYILAGRDGGDCPAEPRSAHLLARRLLELNVSCVIDIYELSKRERREFVKRFLVALVNAPKELWHPVLIVIDEAHDFCPEKESAESAEAVIDLATKGRKRGFCAVFATQRLAKLSKDAAAECNNKLVGRCALDVDRKRAAEELGFTAKAEVLALRDLQPGEFFAFGPALSRDVVRVKSGGVETTHPDPLKRTASKPPPPSAKVREVLAKLADLPKEAMQEAQDLGMANKQIAELRRELKAASKDTPKAAIVTGPRREDLVTIRALQSALETAMKFIVEVTAKGFDAPGIDKAEIEKAMTATVTQIERLISKSLDQRQATLDKLRLEAQRVAAKLKAILDNQDVTLKIDVRHNEPFTVTPPMSAPTPRGNGTATEGLVPARQRILDTIAWLEAIGIAQVDKTQLALFCGVSPTSGGYFNNLGSLRSAGLISYPASGQVELTDDGRATAHAKDAPADQAELHAQIERLLPPAKWKIIAELIRAYPKALGKDDLAERIGVSPTSGGYFNNLGSLRSLGLLDYPQAGTVIARPILFLDR